MLQVPRALPERIFLYNEDQDDRLPSIFHRKNHPLPLLIRPRARQCLRKYLRYLILPSFPPESELER